MAALETIRTKFGVVISVVIALSLLLFILDNDTLMKWFSGDTADAHKVAVIDGQTVTIEEFQAQLESLKNLYGGSTGAEREEAMRNEAWQFFLDKHLFVKNATAAGIKVGVEELKDITTGEHISPVIAQSFPTKADLEAFINQNEEGWNYILDVVRNQQYYAKYNALFVNSSYVNPLMLTNAIEENNVTADVDFVMVPFGYVNDTTINVSSSEIKKYYKDHKKMFRQIESRDLEYVMIEVTPSSEDIAKAEADFNALYTEFSSTDNMKAFLLRNSSEKSYDEYWYKAGELNSVSRDVNTYAFESNAAVSDIIKSGDSFIAARVMASEMRSETISVKLMPMPADSSELTPEILAELDALEATDMTQSRVFPGCEQLFDAKPNTVITFDNYQYGKIAAKLVSKSEPVLMKKVAVLQKTAVPSKETFSKFYAQANTVASRANHKYDNFKTVADTMGLYVHPASKVARNNDKYGVVENARELTNWAFNAKKGEVSDIITVNQKYFFVAALTGVHKEGFAPVDEVSSQIRNVLYNEKLGDKKLAEVSEKISGKVSLDEIAEVLGTTISSKEDVAFSSLSSQSLDPAFIGAIAAAEEGSVSAPVKGSFGVYVFRVNSRSTGSFYTEDDAKSNNLRAMQYSLQTLLPVMMDDADVKDNRARFF